MKFYIPFGDYSGDGHKQYCNILVSAPSMERVTAGAEIVRESDYPIIGQRCGQFKAVGYGVFTNDSSRISR